VCTASAKEWQEGVTLARDPFLGQAEKLRAAVVKKNELAFRRWRPFNDFAEHWGYIGADFRRYDEQVAGQEALIARLRRPAPLSCEVAGRPGWPPATAASTSARVTPCGTSATAKGPAGPTSAACS
jgi:hypothetical protein